MRERLLYLSLLLSRCCTTTTKQQQPPSLWFINVFRAVLTRWRYFRQTLRLHCSIGGRKESSFLLLSSFPLFLAVDMKEEEGNTTDRHKQVVVVVVVAVVVLVIRRYFRIISPFCSAARLPAAHPTRKMINAHRDRRRSRSNAASMNKTSLFFLVSTPNDSSFVFLLSLADSMRKETPDELQFINYKHFALTHPLLCVLMIVYHFPLSGKSPKSIDGHWRVFKLRFE